SLCKQFIASTVLKKISTDVEMTAVGVPSLLNTWAFPNLCNANLLIRGSHEPHLGIVGGEKFLRVGAHCVPRWVAEHYRKSPRRHDRGKLQRPMKCARYAGEIDRLGDELVVGLSTGEGSAHIKRGRNAVRRLRARQCPGAKP